MCSVVWLSRKRSIEWIEKQAGELQPAARPPHPNTRALAALRDVTTGQCTRERGERGDGLAWYRHIVHRRLSILERSTIVDRPLSPELTPMVGSEVEE
jgi:hypothetical protein